MSGEDAVGKVVEKVGSRMAECLLNKVYCFKTGQKLLNFIKNINLLRK